MTKRDAILDAATVVFAARGFHGATIAAVARECGVADGTLYNYFPDKRAVLGALLDRLVVVENAKLELGVRAQADFADLLRAFVHQRLTRLWEARELIRAVLPEILCDHALRQRYFTDVVGPAQVSGRAAIRSGLGGAGAHDDAQLARVITGAAMGIVIMALLGDPVLEDDLDACAKTLTRVLLDGVGTTDPAAA